MSRILVRSLRSVGILATGILFLTAGGALGFDAHDCPHHDAVVGAPPAAPPDQAEEEQHHAHGGQREGAPHSPGHSGPCRCVGTCSASSVVPLVSGALSTALPTGSTRRVRDEAPPVSIAHRTVAYLIPFPIPPPFQL